MFSPQRKKERKKEKIIYKIKVTDQKKYQNITCSQFLEMKLVQLAL